MIKIKLLNHSLKNSYKYKANKDDTVIFCLDEREEFYDFAVAFEKLDEKTKLTVPSENLIFITGEPPSVKTYNQDFLNQFGAVITCHKEMLHKNKKIMNCGMPWFVKKTYDKLKEIKTYKKTKLISIITSNKQFTEGHRKRYEFALKLKEQFGDKIDLYGKGINEVEDKWDAIADYKYHIAIENSYYEEYWTEKLSDSYLCGAYPIYSGCPNVLEYFSSKSMTPIDINDFEKSVEIIEKIINSNAYENSINELLHSKELILDKYNLFNNIASFCKENYNSNLPKQRIALKPEDYFTNKSYTVYREFKKRPFYFIFDLLKGKVRL